MCLWCVCMCVSVVLTLSVNRRQCLKLFTSGWTILSPVINHFSLFPHFILGSFVLWGGVYKLEWGRGEEVKV